MKKLKTSSKLMHWMSAASSFGEHSFLSPIIQVEYNDKNEVHGFEIIGNFICVAQTSSGAKFSIHSIFDNNRNPVSVNMKGLVSQIEHPAYSSEAAQIRIQYLMHEFINKSGVMRMKIHVWKKVFESTGEATVAIIITDTLEKENND